GAAGRQRALHCDAQVIRMLRIGREEWDRLEQIRPPAGEGCPAAKAAGLVLIAVVTDLPRILELAQRPGRHNDTAMLLGMENVVLNADLTRVFLLAVLLA